MTAMEYTDEQIIEALEVRMPHDRICREAYDLINRLRQKTNIENNRGGDTLAEFGSEIVVCPYYHRADKNRICCEGLYEHSTLTLVFQSQTVLNKHRMHFCCNLHAFRECYVCQVLDKKWGVEDGKVQKQENSDTGRDRA